MIDWELYTLSEVADVSTDDNAYVEMPSNNFNGVCKLHMFKDRTSKTTNGVLITVAAKATMAPTSSPVRLQIYNVSTGLWETLSSNTTAGANEEFTLTGGVTNNKDDYYDSSLAVLTRVYQITELPI